MNDLIFVKCWLLEGVSQKTGEIYYRFTTKFNRSVQLNGTALGNTSYSKLIPGQQTGQPIHTIFCNDMNEQMFIDAIRLNDGSDEFYMGIPKKESDGIAILNQSEYAELGTNAQEQISVQE